MRVFSVCVLIGLAFLSQGNFSTAAPSSEKDRESIPEPLHPVAEAVNGFGAKVLNAYRSDNAKGSVVFSPLSLSMSFFLLYRGAAGRTRRELATLFGFGDKEVRNALNGLGETLSEQSSALMASRLYIDESIEVEKKYRNEIGRSSIHKANFGKNAAGERKRINRWVKKKTSGFIPQLIDEGALTAKTLFVIVNALYFKGTWQVPFPEEDTTNGVFKGVYGRERVPFMTLKDRALAYKEFEELDGVMVVLPYLDRQFSMYVFVPNKKNGWKKAEKHFHSYAGSIFDSGYDRQQFESFRLPKWETEATLDNLPAILTELGIPTTFSNKADFSNIAKGVTLSVTDVLHKAKIVVDEKGTEAAAATAIFSVRSAVAFPAITVTVDRPFLYFIVSNADRVILFQGTQTSIKPRT